MSDPPRRRRSSGAGPVADDAGPAGDRTEPTALITEDDLKALGETPDLEEGTLLGHRYEITGAFGTSPFGALYRAVDRQAARVVAVRHIHPGLLSAKGAPERLYAEVNKARKVEHKNIVKTIGLVTGDGLVTVVSQLVPGDTLRELITERMAAGGPAFSLRGAYNVVAHLANALAYAHHVTCHAGITASNILVNRAGRIKMAEFGLAPSLPGALAGVAAADRHMIAPEILQSPPEPSVLADVYALGALFFELVTGKPYSEGATFGALGLGLPEELDPILARFVAPMEERVANVEQLKAALGKVVAALPPRSEVSVMFAVRPPRAASAVPAARPVRPPPPQTVPPSAPAIDPHEARWIVRKGKLDFGPYTLAQVKEQIAVDEVTPGHLLVDTETRKEVDIEQHPALSELAHHAATRRSDAKRARVEATVIKQDKRMGTTLYVGLGLALVALVVGAILLFRVLGSGGDSVKKPQTALLGSADLADLKVGTVRHVEETPHPHAGGARPPGSKPGKDDGFGEQTLDMNGDVGTERLDDSQLNAVLVKAGGSLGGCLRANGGGTANIDFIVLGTGKVSAVRVNNEGKTPLANCIRGVMQGLQFPTFNGARTQASFPISVGGGG